MMTLRQLRIHHGITMRKLAELLSSKRGGDGYEASLSRLEKQLHSPTIERLRDVVEAMGFELEVNAVKNGEKIPLDLTRAKDTSKKLED